MKSKRPFRVFSKTMTAVGLAMAVSACTTLYKNDWKETSDVPDLGDPAQRAVALLDYCKKLHERENLNLAAGICNRAHEVDPTNPEPLIALARVLEDMQLSDSAIEAYRAALLLDPQQTDALYGLGKIYIDRKQYGLATEPLEVAVLMESDDARVYNALGVVMDQQGQHETAQTYYRQGLAYSPRNVSLRNNLGLSMVLDGRSEEGMAMLRDVAAEPESGPMAGRNLAMAAQIVARNQASRSVSPGQTMSTVPQPEDDQQVSEGGETPVNRGEWPEDDLSTLSPSTGTPGSGASEPAANPVPLLEPYQHRSAVETAPMETAPAKTARAETAPAETARATIPARDDGVTLSIDQEIVAATSPLVEETVPMSRPSYEPAPQTAARTAARTATQPAAQSARPSTAPQVATAVAQPTRNRDGETTVPSTGPARYTAEARTRAAARKASANQIAAETEVSPNWSLAAQAIFATSMAEVPPARRTTVREELATNDAIHAAPARSATAAAAGHAARTSPHGEFGGAPASGPSLAAQGYPVDDSWFYTAQLASYYSAERAREGWEILRESAGEALEGQNAFILRADLGEPMGTVFRVRTGTMTDEAAALQFCQDLQAKGLDCMPVKASRAGTAEALVDKICQGAQSDHFCRTNVQRSSLADDDGIETAG